MAIQSQEEPRFFEVYLQNYWITLELRVPNLKFSVYFKALRKESPGYTTLMGVRP